MRKNVNYVRKQDKINLNKINPNKINLDKINPDKINLNKINPEKIKLRWNKI